MNIDIFLDQNITDSTSNELKSLLLNPYFTDSVKSRETQCSPNIHFRHADYIFNSHDYKPKENYDTLYFIEVNSSQDSDILIKKITAIREAFSFSFRVPIIGILTNTCNIEKKDRLIYGLDDILPLNANKHQCSVFFSRWIPAKKNLTASSEKKVDFNKKILDQLSEIDIDSQVIDLKECLHLANDNIELANDLLEMMLNSLQQTKDEITGYFLNHNSVSLKNAVHKLKGSCCYCGIPNLRNSCIALDRQLKTHDKDNFISLEKYKNTLIEDINTLIKIKQKIDAIPIACPVEGNEKYND